MTSYKEIQAEIEKLQRQVAEQRESELSSAMQQIINLMKEYDITIREVQASVIKRTVKGSRPAKFRNPETGDIWYGRGRMPLWLSGQDKERFRV